MAQFISHGLIFASDLLALRRPASGTEALGRCLQFCFIVSRRVTVSCDSAWLFRVTTGSARNFKCERGLLTD